MKHLLDVMKTPIAWLGGLMVGALVAACSGGGGTVVADISTGGTGGVPPTGNTVVVGPVSGLGSVVVNGIKFDDAGASVTINGVANRPVSEIKLGMFVEIRGRVNSDRVTGTATEIDAKNAVNGPVTIAPSGNSLTVLGQTVRVDGATVFDGARDLSEIRADDAVEVFGPRDASNVIVATRIERKPPVVPSVTTVELRGQIANLTATNFSLGGAAVNYSGTTVLRNLPGGLANGLFVKVQGVVASGGVVNAREIEADQVIAAQQGDDVEVEGFITAFVSAAQFTVDRRVINASNARFEGGTAADLANGRRVQVEGRLANGVVVASKVEIKQTIVQQPVQTEVEGFITDFVSASSFKVRGQLVDASRATFDNGTAASLADGRVVKVKGALVGNVIQAQTVEFRDQRPPDNVPLVVSGAITDFVSATNFRVNGQAVTTTAQTRYANGVVTDLANGRRVTVTGTVTSGVLTAATIVFEAQTPTPGAVPVELDGIISSFVSPTQFAVNGVSVTTNAQTTYRNGSASDLAVGKRVEVKGTVNASTGVVTATSIEFQQQSPTPGVTVEIDGFISNFVSVSSFRVNGQPVNGASATFKDGTVADLANGRRVKVKGPITQGVLIATEIEIRK